MLLIFFSDGRLKETILFGNSRNHNIIILKRLTYSTKFKSDIILKILAFKTENNII